MAKNIMVLAMSTLSVHSEGEQIKSNIFAWKENDVDAKDYYSQLEPASRMIREREGSLDKIIILATPATKELKKFDESEKIKETLIKDLVQIESGQRDFKF